MSFLIGATTITMIVLFAVGVGSSDAQTASPPDRVVDAKLTVKITTALLADQRFSGKQISVVTTGAVTTLRGKVDSEKTREAAADLARRVDGVGEVRNELQVVPPTERAEVDASDLAISRAIEQQFKRDPQLQVVVIDTHVDAGIVALSGQVPNPEIVARAADLASMVPGVRSVKNELSSTARTKPE